MLRSSPPRNPQKPHGGKHDPPPNPDDRYAPKNVVRLDMVDIDGAPVCVLLTPRAAAKLADELFGRLYLADAEGGAG